MYSRCRKSSAITFWNKHKLVSYTSSWTEFLSSRLLRGVWWFETNVSALPIRSIFKRQTVFSLSKTTAWPLKMGPIGSAETTVSNHLTPLNNPKDKITHKLVTSLISQKHLGLKAERQSYRQASTDFGNGSKRSKSDSLLTATRTLCINRRNRNKQGRQTGHFTMSEECPCMQCGPYLTYLQHVFTIWDSMRFT